MPAFELIPRKVPAVQTKYRKIVTEIPVPESIGILEHLRRYEPRLHERPAAGGVGPGRRHPGPRPLGQHLAGLVLRRAGDQRRPRPSPHPPGDPRPGRARPDPQLLFSLGDPRPTGRVPGGRGAGRAGKGLPADHRGRGLRMRGQAGADLGTQARRRTGRSPS